MNPVAPDWVETHSHRRFNALLGEWVLCSPHRTNRPWQGDSSKKQVKEIPVYDENCYLCPGNKRVGGTITNPNYTTPWTFPNDFPALQAPPSSSSSSSPSSTTDTSNTSSLTQESQDHLKGLFHAEKATGSCRVSVFGPSHCDDLATLSIDAIHDVLNEWSTQLSELSGSHEWVQLFENRGAMVGASNPHPHCQIWATDHLPDVGAKELARQAAWTATHGPDHTLLGDYAAMELKAKERVVVQGTHWMVVCPYWGYWPFETLVLPCTPSAGVPSLAHASQESLRDLAQVLQRMIRAFDALFGVSFPYCSGWHSAPSSVGSDSGFITHAHYFPPLLRSATVKKFVASYELLSELQRDWTPETSAARLRAALERVDSPSPPPVVESPGASSFDMTLVTGAGLVYTPEKLDAAPSFLIAGGKIVALVAQSELSGVKAIASTVHDVAGGTLVPGFVDIHVHLLGGGGEAGPTSSVPPLTLSQLVQGGLTTVVGLLGLDSVSKSLDGLLRACRALNESGLSAYMYSGSYTVPPVTLTGSVTRDMMTVDLVRGVGEIAVGDHRGSHPSLEELAKLAGEVRTGGLMSSKQGVLYAHLGPSSKSLKQLFEVVDKYPVPMKHIIPTHVERSPEILQDALDWMRMGGIADVTACERDEAIEALGVIHKEGLLHRAILSSDCGGSIPIFDTASGELTSLDLAAPSILWSVASNMLSAQTSTTTPWTLATVLPLITTNPARALGLDKGQIALGMDADIVALDSSSHAIQWVISRGKVMKSPGFLIKGKLEQ